MIKVSNLSFSVGQKKLLDNLSFTASAGELLVVIGANGAGKSTLMKLLCKEIIPSQGSISIDRVNIKDYRIEDLAKVRAVLAQHNTISISFIVDELVMMGRYPYFDQKPAEKDQQIVKQVMQETGITHLSGRDYNTLSGGEQQRVQIARVIAQVYDQPNACLLLDEPTNGLDLQYQQQIMVLARALADRGYCVVCILHDINFASRFADRILMLKHGKKVAEGHPLQVVNCENIHETFNIKVQLIECEGFNCPLVMPVSALT